MTMKIEALKLLLSLIASGRNFDEAQLDVRDAFLMSDREFNSIAVAYHASVLADLARRREQSQGLAFLSPQAE